MNRPKKRPTGGGGAGPTTQTRTADGWLGVPGPVEAEGIQRMSGFHTASAPSKESTQLILTDCRVCRVAPYCVNCCSVSMFKKYINVNALGSIHIIM